ncbi:hypothetical protein N0V91_005890 [Didymella pomorum]|uniref:Uncharacterized protein n=1 Tax=Didymella pomorum TaxID=749634 RepID=A0A9W8ZBW7_9PLEO|nr:hypothetical protein N0V91_005890 [Didymella pomorum]
MAINYFYPIGFGPSANCKLGIPGCTLDISVFQYLPNVPANATFLAVFAVLMVAHIAQGIRYKAWTYMGCVAAGCALELVGYVGRILLHDNPFDFNAFLINLAYVFIPCDIISLVLQGTGGALSAGAETEDGTKVGVDVSKAGLIFQVVTLVLFIGLSSDFLWALQRTHRHDDQRVTRPLKVMIVWLAAATILILVRCIFRIYELKDGYFASAFRDEGTFIAFESVFMIIAVACLNVGHPGRAFLDTSKPGETGRPLDALAEK